MIVIIDYGAGNPVSVVKALKAIGEDSEITSDLSEIRKSDRMILPGVGHFAATKRLRESGIEDAVRERIAGGVPFLGICIGLQWLFEGSEEIESVAGFGALRGHCTRFPDTYKSPHVGWNNLDIVKPSALLTGLDETTFVYYTHNYRAPLVPETIAMTDYAGPFSAAVERDNLFGVQFHPEKSGEAGLQVLRNFARVQRC